MGLPCPRERREDESARARAARLGLADAAAVAAAARPRSHHADGRAQELEDDALHLAGEELEHLGELAPRGSELLHLAEELAGGDAEPLREGHDR